MLTKENVNKVFTGMYYLDYFKFSEFMFPGLHQDYILNKWYEYQESPTRFWGSLDLENRANFVALLNSI